MASKIWTGNALPVAHIVTLTVGGTVAIGDVFTVTVNGKAIRFTATTAVIADAVNGIANLWSGLDSTSYPEFAEVNAGTNSGTSPTAVVLTGRTAGAPFALTVGITSAAGTFAAATAQQATGPHWWSEPANWQGGAVPVSGDDATVSSQSASIRYGLSQSAVALNSLTLAGSVDVGLPPVSPSGYRNYLPTYLAIGAAKVSADTDGPRVRLDTGTGATTVSVDGTGSGDGTAGFLWVGVNAANVVYRNGGTVGVAAEAGQVATLSLFAVDGQTRGESQASVIGAGATVATVKQTGGALHMYCGATLVEVVGGLLAVGGSASLTIAALKAYGGTVTWSAPGTITALTASVAVVRAGNWPGAITGGTVLSANAFPLDPNGTITWGPIAIPPQGVNVVNPGPNRTITVT